MALAVFRGSGFKPETTQYVITCIQDIWSDRSQEKLEALFDYLKSKGVKSEADVETIGEAKLARLIGFQAARSILEHIKETTHEELPTMGFQPETIDYAIACIQDVWPERSEDKLEEVFCYLKSKGVKSEADVETIEEARLCELIGPTATKSILERVKEIDGARNRKPLERLPWYRDGAPEPGTSRGHTKESQSEIIQMCTTFMQMHLQEAEKNRKMMERMETRMDNVIDKMTGNLTSVVKEISDKFTEQIKLQQQLLQTVGGQMSALEQTHQKTASRTQEWMERTQQMNHVALMELTRKVNAALESKEDSVNAMTAALRARPHEVRVPTPVPMPVPVPLCTIM